MERSPKVRGGGGGNKGGSSGGLGTFLDAASLGADVASAATGTGR